VIRGPGRGVRNPVEPRLAQPRGRPDGLARDVSLGMVCARYRDSLDRPRLLQPGEVVQLTIRLNATSNVFQKGHRLILPRIPRE
jgi:predicted acyl esterase